MTVKLEIPNFNHSISILTHEKNELVSDMIRQDKIWEAYETKIILDTLKPGQNFIDVGANIGYYSLIASKQVGTEGRVIAFEPEPQNYALLKNNIELNQLDNVTAVNCGLGHEPGKLELFISQENKGDHRCFDADKNRDAIEIEIRTGDRVFSENTSDLHFIKMDTQGFEANIIKGFRDTISKNAHHLSMIVEFWPFALQENKTSARQLLDELREFDFEVHEIDHINGKLIETTLDKLLIRAEETDLKPESGGFINIFLQPKF